MTFNITKPTEKIKIKPLRLYQTAVDFRDADYETVFVLKQHINYLERLEVRRKIARVDYQTLSLDNTCNETF